MNKLILIQISDEVEYETQFYNAFVTEGDLGDINYKLNKINKKLQSLHVEADWAAQEENDKNMGNDDIPWLNRDETKPGKEFVKILVDGGFCTEELARSLARWYGARLFAEEITIGELK